MFWARTLTVSKAKDVMIRLAVTPNSTWYSLWSQ
jgi:hypothetical protein